MMAENARTILDTNDKEITSSSSSLNIPSNSIRKTARQLNGDDFWLESFQFTDFTSPLKTSTAPIFSQPVSSRTSSKRLPPKRLTPAPNRRKKYPEADVFRNEFLKKQSQTPSPDIVKQNLHDKFSELELKVTNQNTEKLPSPKSKTEIVTIEETKFQRPKPRTLLNQKDDDQFQSQFSVSSIKKEDDLEEDSLLFPDLNSPNPAKRRPAPKLLGECHHDLSKQQLTPSNRRISGFEDDSSFEIPLPNSKVPTQVKPIGDEIPSFSKSSIDTFMLPHAPPFDLSDDSSMIKRSVDSDLSKKDPSRSSSRTSQAKDWKQFHIGDRWNTILKKPKEFNSKDKPRKKKKQNLDEIDPNTTFGFRVKTRHEQVEKLIRSCENAFRHWEKLMEKSKKRDRAIASLAEKWKTYETKLTTLEFKSETIQDRKVEELDVEEFEDISHTELIFPSSPVFTDI